MKYTEKHLKPGVLVQNDYWIYIVLKTEEDIVQVFSYYLDSNDEGSYREYTISNFLGFMNAPKSTLTPPPTVIL